MSSTELPVSPLLWLAAVVPLAVLLGLLVIARWKAASAAPVGYFVTVVVAIVLFGTSLGTVALQSVKGVWDASFIAYVIVPALLLYQVSDEAGAFRSIRRGIEAVTPNDLLHVLAFGWVFSSFLQGITGFGAPIAVVAPLLTAVGVKPLWAVVLPVIGHAWAKSFGTLAVAWEALATVVDIPDPTLAPLAAAVMLGAADVIGGLTIAWLFGRARAIREGLVAIVVVAAIHGLGQLALAPLAPTLANVVPGTVAIAATLVLARTVYAKPSAIDRSPIMRDEGTEASAAAGAEPNGATDELPDGPRSPMPLWAAFAPYVLLIALIMAAELVPPVRDALGSVEIGLPFPALETDYGVRTEATEAYNPFAPLAHPGTFLLISSVLAFLLYRSLGHIRAGRIDEVVGDTVRTSIPSVISLLALIPLATVLEGSGMVLELASGIATVASGPIYAFVSPLIGLLGGFLTGSNLSSNILFGPLQLQAADALSINASIVLAAQTAGGAIGAAIAVSTVLLGLGSVGETGRAGDVIRRTLPYAVATLIVMGAIAVVGVLLIDPETESSALATLPARWGG